MSKQWTIPITMGILGINGRIISLIEKEKDDYDIYPVLYRYSLLNNSLIWMALFNSTIGFDTFKEKPILIIPFTLPFLKLIFRYNKDVNRPHCEKLIEDEAPSFESLYSSIMLFSTFISIISKKCAKTQDISIKSVIITMIIEFACNMFTIDNLKNKYWKYYAIILRHSLRDMVFSLLLASLFMGITNK